MMEDLVQDVYLKLCANNYQILRRVRSDHPNGVYALVRAVAYSTTIDHLRSLRKPVNDSNKTVSLEALQHDLAIDQPAESQLHLQMLFEKIDRLLAEACPPETLERDRIAFWLYYRQGFTAGEIAALPAVGLTVKGVESLLFRLTAALRVQLNPPGEKGLGGSPRPQS
jgi:RNA polymerase sigma-70 factor (ECF subfamily)